MDRNGKNSIRLTWTAPASDGVVEIRYMHFLHVYAENGISV